MSELALNDMTIPGETVIDAIRNAGYDGVQVGGEMTPEEKAHCQRVGLRIAGSSRINRPEDAEDAALRLSDSGCVCGTLHVGWGMEEDAEARSLIEAVMCASQKHRVPLYIETHRASVFQDPWRTVGFIRDYPGLRLNGDFSHWYTGQEMVYGGFENKLRFVAPVLERVRFLDGRIGNPGCIQVDIGDGRIDGQPYVAHFRRLWTESMRGFLQSAQPGDFMIFSPELLASCIYYAQNEDSDRWQQSLVLCRIARECFEAASRPRA